MESLLMLLSPIIILCILLSSSSLSSSSSSSSSSLHSSAPSCHSHQSYALLQFKTSLNNVHLNDSVYHPWSCEQDITPKITTWKNGTNCCSWDGVTCDATSGDVVGLDLSCSALQGTIHPSSFFNLTTLTSLILSKNFLSASIPSSISTLRNLIHLDLSWNNLNGSIPSISNLQNLIHLDLSQNRLTGPIPDVFTRLTKLQTLNLFNNLLGGKFPFSVFSLNSLSTLECSLNKFQGNLPEKVTGLSNLSSLRLGTNLLNGTIPSWCLSLPSLETLDLSDNQFTGNLTPFSSYSLTYLDLCGNKLQGSVPESVSSLVNLTFLCLSSNNSSGPVHFSLFSNLQNLAFLSLSGYNPLLLNSETNVTYSFFNLDTLLLASNNIADVSQLSGAFHVLVHLDLSNNKLSGKVPKWMHGDLGSLDSFSYLNLSNNQLTSLDQFSWYNLEYLDLSSNLFSEDISSYSSICNATYLRVINLSKNEFTGTIPQCLMNLTDLSVLDLHMNRIHGTLPDAFPENSMVETLNLNGNQLEGLLPRSLSNCTGLTVLNVGNNQIEDIFPHWLQTLESLKVLVLRANKFHGPVSTLKMMNGSFASLIILDLSCNSFSGRLPKAYIENFNAMKEESSSTFEYMESIFGAFIFQPRYDDSVTATVKGVNINFTKIPTIFVYIDLSVNKFEGEIPNVIGELQGLRGLNLSHNRLIGPIPKSIENLTNLESLDLSSNMLSGGIPAELTNLNYLAVLNLSQNHLLGAIPQGKQFNTFSNDSYGGNVGLCGLPLSKKCNEDQEQQSPDASSASTEMEEKFGFGWKPVAIGYAWGMVFGIGLGSFVLLFGKPLWLVRMVGSSPNKGVLNRRTRNRTRGNHATMN